MLASSGIFRRMLDAPGMRDWLQCLSMDDLALLTPSFGKSPSPVAPHLDMHQVWRSTDVAGRPDIMSSRHARWFICFHYQRTLAWTLWTWFSNHSRLWMMRHNNFKAFSGQFLFNSISDYLYLYLIQCIAFVIYVNLILLVSSVIHPYLSWWSFTLSYNFVYIFKKKHF